MGILEFFQGLHTPFLNEFFQYITMLGETNFYIIVMTVVYLCMDKRFGYKLGFVIVTNSVLNFGLKEIIHAPRPIGISGIQSIRVETASGYSFPSGHTQGATAFWSVLMLQFKKKTAYLICTSLIVLIGISRLYLGVHWPKDVLGGIIIGLIWLVIAIKLFDKIEITEKMSFYLLLLVPAVIGLFFLKESNYYKLTGVLISFVIGYVIENKYINFQVKCALWKQVVKAFIAILVVLLIKEGVKLLLPTGLLSDLIRYFTIGLWVIAGAPALFKFLFGNKNIENNLSI